MDTKTCPLEFGIPVSLPRPFLAARPFGTVVHADRFVYAGWRNGSRFPIGFEDMPPERQEETLASDKYKVTVALGGGNLGKIETYRLDEIEVNLETAVGQLWFDQCQGGK